MRLSRFHRGEEAQALIEFAILSTAMLFIFLGTVDFSRFLYYDNAVRSAARVGAEVGGGHCAFPTCVNAPGNVIPDAEIMWATYCEAKPNVIINPIYSSCTPGSSPPCASVCTNCSADICVSPGDGSRTITPPTQFSVSVGYSFKPISPLISAFFHESSCFAGDDTTVNHHTLCATSVGRVE